MTGKADAVNFMYRFKYVIALALVAVLVTAQASSAFSISPSTVATYNQFSFVAPHTFEVFTDGTTVYARNGATGAIASSSTSATTVIQYALSNVGSGGKVTIREGTYGITSPLVMPSSVTLEGMGWGTLLQSSGGATTIIRNDNSTGTTTDIVLQNIAVDGQNVGGAPLDGNIVFNNAKRGTITNVKSINSPSEGIKIKASSDFTVSSNFVNVTATGRAGIIAATDTSNVSIVNNVIHNTGGEAIGVYLRASNISIVGNVATITTSGRGHIHVEGTSGNEPTNIAISGNTIVSDYYGIHVLSGVGVSITGNSVKHFSTSALDCIQIEGVSKYITVTGNKLENCAQNGIYLTSTARRIAIDGNTVINPSKVGVGSYNGITIRPAGGAVTDVNIVGNLLDDDNGTHNMGNGIYLNMTTQQINSLNVAQNEFIGYTSSGVAYTLANTTNSQINTSQIKGNVGYAPGKITSPFDSTNNRIGIQSRGTVTQASAPTASKNYVATLTDLVITSTGGTGVSITIQDASGNTIVSGATTLSGYYLPIGWKINFGGFSVAPTVTVAGV